MRITTLLFLSFQFLAINFAAPQLVWASPTPTSPDVIHDQTLRSLDFSTGKTEDFHTLEKGKTNVVIFMSSQCHCSDSHLQTY